jgi:hypothetical protein
MSNNPIPHPSWGSGVARWDTRKLQPLRDVVRQLLQAGLTGADLLWTFISHQIQPL